MGYGGRNRHYRENNTDNKNRTAADVEALFPRGNGNIGTPGCVSFMFDEKDRSSSIKRNVR